MDYLDNFVSRGNSDQAVSPGNTARGGRAGGARAGQGIIVAFLNRKGGVGKTSCCHHLAGFFAQAGRRVLLVDADPQASLTQGLIGPEATEALGKGETLACLFDDAFDPDPLRLIRPTHIENLALVPASSALDGHNLPRPEAAGELQSALRVFLDEVRPAFDVILVDCPPNLYLCSWSALVAADFVVVPFQPEDYGSQGIIAIRRAIEQARSRHNPRLRLMGFLLTMVQRRLGLHAAYQRTLRQLYGEQVFEVNVPRAKDYSEAVSARLPITRWRPRSAAAQAIAALAAEMERRAAVPPGHPPGGLPQRLLDYAGEESP
jgi:chromosome partitioning protein